MVKAVGLISGGLDSLLATRLLQDQGIKVIGVAFRSPFFGAERAKEAARILGIPLRIVDITDELLQIVKNPKHGRGSGMNPCIDCHALMIRKAGEIMAEEGAQFVFTGEVLGQRPFSQNRTALRIVEEESGLGDLLLRPLSAKRLPPTRPEREGWVDRERLLGLHGRGRKVQLELAEAFGIKDPPSSAGGCLLTDPAFSRRLRDLLEHLPDPSPRDVELLKVGRHFRLSPKTKAIVGRRRGENEKLQAVASPQDLLMEAEGYPGPVLFIPGGGRESDWPRAAALCLRYSDSPKDRPGRVRCRGVWEGVIETFPLLPEECDRLML